MNGMSAPVQPGSEFRGGPSVVEPVTRVCGAVANLLGDGFIVLTSSAEEGITIPRFRATDSVLIQESFQLGIRPAIGTDI